MDTAYNQFKKCGVKILTEIGGSDDFSSGFLYVTSPQNEYNYVFTTKHALKESHDDEDFFIEQIKYVEVQCYDQKRFTRYEYIPQKELQSRLLLFEGDLVLLFVMKNDSFDLPYIQVSDSPSTECWAWATTKGNEDRLLPLDLKLSDIDEPTYTIAKWNKSEQLKGCSGAGIISEKKPILHGFIQSYPAEDFQGGLIDAVNVSFREINNKLYNNKLEQLSIDDSRVRRNVLDKRVVDISIAPINSVKLNLGLARKRIMYDSYDDWFHDPLNYIDLSHEDFLFDYFDSVFVGEKYKVESAEVFYLPKKAFTLRKAMIMSYADRIYFAALVEVIGERLDDALCPMVYSARYNPLPDKGIMLSGLEQWKKWKYQLSEFSTQYKYVIEIDILNFYDNINIDFLCNKIATVAITENERNAAEELRTILKAFSKGNQTGIPQNSDVSSLIATFYLNQVDAYMRHHVSVYMRFMDDIRIFCNSEYEARGYLTLIEKEVRRLGLSLNGQKTQILKLKPRKKVEKDRIKEEYSLPFDLDQSKLYRFSSSKKTELLNEGFHLAVNMLINNMKVGSIGNSDSERKLNQAITSVRKCVSKGVNVQNNSSFNEFLENAGDLLKERPWVTTQVCTLIGVLETKFVPDKFWEKATEIVLNSLYNIYSWQCYHLWLLFEKHKVEDVKLRKYASNYLDSNDETSRAVIAAMMIYMGTIDDDYRRVILRKYNEDFTNGHFQERVALIVLRAFETSDIKFKNSKSESIHKSLNRFKDKDFVYIPGEKNDSEIDLELLQIYSL